MQRFEYLLIPKIAEIQNINQHMEFIQQNVYFLDVEIRKLKTDLYTINLCKHIYHCIKQIINRDYIKYSIELLEINNIVVNWDNIIMMLNIYNMVVYTFSQNLIMEYLTTNNYEMSMSKYQYWYNITMPFAEAAIKDIIISDIKTL